MTNVVTVETTAAMTEASHGLVSNRRKTNSAFEWGVYSIFSLDFDHSQMDPMPKPFSTYIQDES
ncbi:hypothetical protein PNH38_05050 [Anoxybacillus rupiensis]|uniref:Uncharacterized protein n=1 Tax=Anoxybacteroides rupiense TaxID=311460 RepID=A0ABT5W1Q3_9BACL|nr:hypothetical protein [Anoxybacillus rupiensis]